MFGKAPMDPMYFWKKKRYHILLLRIDVFPSRQLMYTMRTKGLTCWKNLIPAYIYSGHDLYRNWRNILEGAGYDESQLQGEVIVPLRLHFWSSSLKKKTFPLFTKQNTPPRFFLKWLRLFSFRRHPSSIKSQIRGFRWSHLLLFRPFLLCPNPSVQERGYMDQVPPSELTLIISREI